MRAAILEDGTLAIREVPTPEPGADEALVHLRAAGVCHSDLHIMQGDWPWVRAGQAMPLGHEGIGVVEALGPAAEQEAAVAVGDRVILGLGGAGGGYWCGACEYCLSRRPRLCAQAKGIMGTYAEHIRLWARSLVVLPDAVDDEQVPLACGGLTAYSAVKKLWRFGVPPGKEVAIIGAAGGLGHYGVQVARAFGYKVLGVDVGEERTPSSCARWGPRPRTTWARRRSGSAGTTAAPTSRRSCSRPGWPASTSACTHSDKAASSWPSASRRPAKASSRSAPST